ncbi:hypothetical protein D3C72_1744430 [compost metagenome]
MDEFINTASQEEKTQALTKRYIGLKTSSQSITELKCHFEFGIKICVELPDPPATPATPSIPVQDPNKPGSSEKPNKPNPVKPPKPKK